MRRRRRVFKVEMGKVNQVYRAEEAQSLLLSGQGEMQAENNKSEWTQVRWQRQRHRHKSLPEEEELKSKAEKDDTRAKGKVMAVQDARMKIVKPVNMNIEVEAEKTGGLRAGKASPPVS